MARSRLLSRYSQRFIGLFRRRIGLLAVRTDRPHQTLGEGNQQHRRHQKRLDAHVDESRNRARRVVGVDRAQHPVAGLGGLNGNGGRFRVADFAHHDGIRILAQNGPQPARKGHPGLAIQLNLADVVDPVFHRILERHDIDVRLIDRIQNGVQTGAFAAAGRPCAEDHAVRLVDDALDFFHIRIDHAQPVKRVNPSARIQKPQHQVLAVDGGNGGHADVDFFFIQFEGKTAVLRNA